MHEEIAKGFVAVAKFVAYYIIWSFVLFNLGRASLLLVTLGQYPEASMLSVTPTKFRSLVSWYSSWLGRLLPCTTTRSASMPNISFKADGFAAA